MLKPFSSILLNVLLEFRFKNVQNSTKYYFSIVDYHGINGNISLDRRSEFVQSPNRYELALTAERNASLTRDVGTYDITEAEHRAKNEKENIINNNNSIISPTSTLSTPSSYYNGSQNGNASTLEMNGDVQKKKWPSGDAYFLAKEILMTERTYKKDLDVINTKFRKALAIEDVESLQPLFEHFEAMGQHHSVFLRDLEHRIVLWEGRGTQDNNRIGDVMLKNMVVLPVSFILNFPS